MARHSVDPVPSLRVVRQTVPQAVEGAITRAMAKVPADRFGSVQRFLEALDTPEPVSVPTAVSPASQVRAERRVGRPVMVAVGTAVLAAAIVWSFAAGWRSRDGRPASSAIEAVAVLPFEDLAGSPDSSYMAEGMTDGLIAHLAQIGSLKVISRSSGAVAQGKALSL